jgi:glucosyl-3-phosphoglycerate phosphatase
VEPEIKQQRTASRGVLVVRHGQTLWNATHRWQGWADVDLDGLGVAQAEAAAHRLASVLDATPRIVSSDLLRASHTAEVFADKLDTTVSEVLTDLRERNVGNWSGKTTPEIEAAWPGQLDAWRRGDLPMIPGGESESDLNVRISRALERLCREAAADNTVIVAVTHGGVMRTLTRNHHVDPRPVPNLGATWFRWNGTSTEHAGEVDLLDGSNIATLQLGTAL